MRVIGIIAMSVPVCVLLVVSVGSVAHGSWLAASFVGLFVGFGFPLMFEKDNLAAILSDEDEPVSLSEKIGGGLLLSLTGVCSLACVMGCIWLTVIILMEPVRWEGVAVGLNLLFLGLAARLGAGGALAFIRSTGEAPKTSEETTAPTS